MVEKAEIGNLEPPGRREECARISAMCSGRRSAAMSSLGRNAR